ncbi:MAG: T9SS type A sorting domain-containing protein [Candidatus Marinimicrobia bacterium]|nr:T9SS type A sorting domain-containing protein [Candidatus Neomarinimicrobiota bacterium]
MKRHILTIIITSMAIGLLSANSLSLGDNGDGTWNVNYSSDADIGGFQFNLDGAAASAGAGGEAGAAGFMVSAGGNTVLGFSLMGTVIPSGEGVLTILTVSGTPTGLSGLVVSDGTGSPLDFIYDPGSDDEPITDGCDLPDYNIFLGANGEVFYNSPEAIGGFQFTVDGVSNISASGGDATAAGFMISGSGNMVLGFSFTGATFGPCGTMLNVSYDGIASGISGIIISDGNGQPIEISYFDGGGEPTVLGCMDDSACNYDSDATDDDGSCVYAEANYDCDGNCVVDIDCLGECGGSAYEITLCEDTDGDGLGNSGTEIIECIEGGRDITDGCDLPDFNISLGANGEVFYNSSDAIGGFQFNVDGTTIGSATGGDAQSAGFMISAAGSTAIGFSLTGSTFGPGCGIVTNLTLNGEASGLSSLVFSDAFGASLPFVYYVPTDDVDMVADCTDMYPDCESNIVDCSGECDGSLVEDCAGECGGSSIEDECGICAGDGTSCSGDDNYYTVNLEPTGTNQLTILSDSISSLEPGDQIGIFDESALTNYNNCDNDIGELLVGAGVWAGSQLNIVSIGSNDLCSFGGVQLSGFVEGNAVIIKVWRESEQMEYATVLTWGTGSGNFGDIIQSVSEISLLDPNSCEDDNAAVGAFGGCAGAIAALGCDFVFGGVPISESCPVSCDNCPDISIPGCMEMDACNYDSAATENDGSCEYAMTNYDCDGNCVVEIDCAGECGGSAIFDMCDICDSDSTNDCSQDCSGEWGGTATVDECGTCDTDSSNDCVQDCNGEWGGTLMDDDCGVCDGDNSSCTGCMDVDACNYDPEATVNDNSCTYVDGICETCDAGVIVGHDADADGVCDADEVVGCQDTNACNYNELATDSDAESCTYTDGICESCDEGIVVGHDIDEDGVCDADEVVGCQDMEACNYDELATDSGDCTFATTWYADTDGDGLGDSDDSMDACEQPEDYVADNTDTEPYCATNDTDECGVCAGDNSTCSGCTDSDALNYDASALVDDNSCIYGPEGFEFTQSSQQAFYYISSASDINANNLEAGEDIIAAFNGDVCVGAVEWSGDEFTVLVVMGNDGYEYSQNYLNDGDYPTFKIYDASENSVYAGYSSSEHEFEDLGVFFIDSISAGMLFELNTGANLISFPNLPEDPSIGSIFSNVVDDVYAILGEGMSSVPVNGNWIGALQEASCTSGYWAVMHEGNTISVPGGSCTDDQEYNIHYGANLVSYPFHNSQPIISALPEEVQGSVYGIIGEYSAAHLQGDGTWVGSLMNFNPKKGYWFISNSDFDFTYNSPADDLIRNEYNFIERERDTKDLFTSFGIELSSITSFYFLEDGMVKNTPLTENDLLIARCNGEIVGAKHWVGEYSDIPVMGVDGRDETIGYCEIGDEVAIYLVDEDGLEFRLNGEVQTFDPNSIQVVNTLFASENELISDFSLVRAFPNPFNPSITISFGINENQNIEIGIFNINGQKIDVIQSGILSAGFHSFIWNGSNVESGLYFIEIVGNSQLLSSQKVVLIK